MSTRIRFTTARQVADAYPSAAEEFGEIPDDAAPLAFLKTLSTGEDPSPALLFAALMLPKREAVWWGCLTLRGAGGLDADAQEGMDAAEAWVRTPEEKQRRRAGEVAEAQYFEGRGAMIAFAAFASGGSLAPAGLQAVAPPPDVCGRSVYMGVLMACADDDPLEQIGRMRAAVASAGDLAMGGDGTGAWKNRVPLTPEDVLPPEEELAE